MQTILLVHILSLAFAQVPADAVVVLSGRPVAKAEGSVDATRHSTVADAERDKLKVVIVRRGARYFWLSRENREVERRVSGAFHVFVDRTDGGYVRVFDRSTLPESMRPEGAQFEYIEHVPQFRGTLTYWGTLDEFVE